MWKNFDDQRFTQNRSIGKKYIQLLFIRKTYIATYQPELIHIQPLKKALAIADVLLARFAGEGSGPIQLWTNEKWLVIIASGGYVIVLSAIVGCYFRGQPIPLFLVRIFCLPHGRPRTASTSGGGGGHICHFWHWYLIWVTLG